MWTVRAGQSYALVFSSCVHGKPNMGMGLLSAIPLRLTLSAMNKFFDNDRLVIRCVSQGNVVTRFSSDA